MALEMQSSYNKSNYQFDKKTQVLSKMFVCQSASPDVLDDRLTAHLQQTS